MVGGVLGVGVGFGLVVVEVGVGVEVGVEVGVVEGMGVCVIVEEEVDGFDLVDVFVGVCLVVGIGLVYVSMLVRSWLLLVLVSVML